jgi:hypothetical protein
MPAAPSCLTDPAIGQLLTAAQTMGSDRAGLLPVLALILRQLAGLPWRQIPVAHDVREKGHGRAERRTVKVTAVAAGLAFRTPPRPSRSCAADGR